MQKINKYIPTPALAICLVASYSLVTGLPGSTVDNCDIVLVTVDRNLLSTSILMVSEKQYLWNSIQFYLGIHLLEIISQLHCFNR